MVIAQNKKIIISLTKIFYQKYLITFYHTSIKISRYILHLSKNIKLVEGPFLDLPLTKYSLLLFLGGIFLLIYLRPY
jgi:hypothetical protein